jgi:hypothetical protein
VSEHNVVPFEISPRAAQARRGSSDKTPVPPTVEVECPRCDAVLCLDEDLADDDPEILCAGCEAPIRISSA